MIPVTQTKVVVKNSQGEMVMRGNCFAACVASILEKTIDEVPNVETLFHIEGSLWITTMLAYLNSIGWDLVTDERFSVYHLAYITTDEQRHNAQVACRDQYYFVTGDSPRGIKHCCIYKNGVLVHDPHPTREGLITHEYFESVYKL